MNCDSIWTYPVKLSQHEPKNLDQLPRSHQSYKKWTIPHLKSHFLDVRNHIYWYYHSFIDWICFSKIWHCSGPFWGFTFWIGCSSGKSFSVHQSLLPEIHFQRGIIFTSETMIHMITTSFSPRQEFNNMSLFWWRKKKKSSSKKFALPAICQSRACCYTHTQATFHTTQLHWLCWFTIIELFDI